MSGNLASASPSQSPVPFAFKNHQIRTVINDGHPWFVARDICRALDVSWSSRTLDAIPVDWKGVIKLITPSGERGGGKQTLRIIAEPGVYKLAFRSNKPEADEFTNWVASEVLPAIRKTGQFQATAPTEQAALPLPLTPDQQQHLRNLVAARAKAIPGAVGFSQVWERVKNKFGVARYKDIPAERFAEVVEYLLAMEVKKLPAPASVPVPLVVPRSQRITYLDVIMADHEGEKYLPIKEKFLHEVYAMYGRNIDRLRRIKPSGKSPRAVGAMSSQEENSLNASWSALSSAAHMFGLSLCRIKYLELMAPIL